MPETLVNTITHDDGSVVRSVPDNDWLLDSGASVEEVRRTTDMPELESCGPSAVQVVPSGPAIHGQAIQRILLMSIYAARRACGTS